MSEPQRIQLKRRRGFRLPEGARSVARPSRFGNPWTAEWAMEAGHTAAEAREVVVRLHRDWLTCADPDLLDVIPSGAVSYDRLWVLAHLGDIAGRDLACYCDHDGPCHAATLIELANEEKRDDRG